MKQTALKQTKDISSNEWQTPPWLFNRLQEVFNFEIDGASNSKNALLPEFRTIQNPFKITDIFYCRIFINPPFNAQKSFLSVNVDFLPITKLTCILVPFRPETKLWHQHVWPNATIFVFNKRIQYIHPETKQEVRGASFPSCLVFYGNLSKYDTKKLNDLGMWIRRCDEM